MIGPLFFIYSISFQLKVHVHNFSVANVHQSMILVELKLQMILNELKLQMQSTYLIATRGDLDELIITIAN